MEPHKNKPFVVNEPNIEEGPKAYFEKALAFTLDNYKEEMEHISATSFEDITPEFFFREYVWVVHATGFSAKAVGKFFPRLTEAYGPFNKLALENFEESFSRIKLVCNNAQKAKAIHKTAGIILEASKSDWEKYKNCSINTAEKLIAFPYIGKITCYHLARNIGILDSVKPDLHLVRMADYWGFKDCVEMCKSVKPESMPLGIVDLVFWYAASTFGTINIRKNGQR